MQEKLYRSAGRIEIHTTTHNREKVPAVTDVKLGTGIINFTTLCTAIAV
jgi:hypothetical protein